MTRPSGDWLGFAELSSESNRYKQVELVLSSANFEHLKDRALRSRRRHDTNALPDLDCSINLAQFTTGFDNLVLELAFSDDVFWIARIPHRAINDDTKTLLLSEIATLKIISQRTTIPVPRVFDFEMSSDQPFGYPYVLMQYLGGRTVTNGLADSIPQEHHSKVAKQLANVFAELQCLTFSRIGRLWCGETVDEPVEIIPMAWHHSPGPLGTSLEYFYHQRRGENREIIALHPDDADWLTACWVLNTAMGQIVIEDRVQGPFPLCHLDLHFGNLLFDDEYNLTGVIDWSNAQAAPLEQLSVCPELVVFPGRSDEKNQPIVEFKKLVIHFLKVKEDEIVKAESDREGGLFPLDQQQGTSEQSRRLTPLSAYMDSASAELMHRQYMASPKGSLWAGKRVAKLMYGEHVSWEQLKEVYGRMSLG